MSRISIAVSAGVYLPETARTFELLMERALTASEGLRQVAANTPGNLLAKMETPAPVPQATSPRTFGEEEERDWETRRPTSAPAE